MRIPTALIMGVFLVIFTIPTPAAAEHNAQQWRQLHSPHARILFRPDMETQAQQIAHTLDYFYPQLTYSLKTKPDYIPLILWEDIFDSNGCFAIPPRRIDFYTRPHPDYNFIGTHDWFLGLVLHEYRHAVQYAHLKRNFNRTMYRLGGEEALSFFVGHNIPTWLLEGDAVGTETALSQSGRGRIPYFSLLYKVNLLERGGFHYAKQVSGSFLDQVPNHYRVGYYMTTHLRRQYGKDILNDILDYTTWPMPFPMAVKKATGKDLLTLYQEMNDELKRLWEKQLEGLRLTAATTLTARNSEAYTDYLYPQVTDVQQIIALKKGISTPAQFVCFDRHQKETPLYLPSSIVTDVPFSMARNQLVWVQKIPDPLFPQKRQYSVIKRYDLTKQEVTTLTHHSRYATAALSPDATQIVAVETDTAHQHHLVILSASDGKVMRRLPNPENHFYRTPRWLANGTQVVAMKHRQQQVTISLVDAETGVSEDLIPYTTEHIGVPVAYGSYVFYNSACSGIDNIYALDLVSKRRYQVTSRKYGAYDATISADGQWIIFNDFAKDGMNIARMPLNPQQWTPLEEVEDRDIRYYAPLVAQELPQKAQGAPPEMPEPYPSTPYTSLPYLHSWSWPWHMDPKEGQKVGLILQCENLLRTTKLEAGGIYLTKGKDQDFEENAAEAFAKLTYNAWMPHITLEGKAARALTGKTIKHTKALHLEVPLEVYGDFYTYKAAGRSTFQSIDRSNMDSSDRSSMEHKHVLEWSRSSPSSKRDIEPPWKQSITLEHHAPLFSDFFYEKWLFRNPPPPERITKEYVKIFNKNSITGALYIPGAQKHHSLAITPRYQAIQLCKGSTDREIYSLATSYTWPLYYPDWSIGYLLHVQRLWASVMFNPRVDFYNKLWQYNRIYSARIIAEIDIPLFNQPFYIGVAISNDSSTEKRWSSDYIFNFKQST